MTIRLTATSGIAALAVVGLAAVTACSSSSSSTPAAAGSTSASAASSSASASSASSNPLSGGGSSGSVVIGSANFPENEVLAEVYALALQAKGVKVTTKLNIGAREAYYPQIEKGTISIIPEYNGTLLSVEVDKNSTAKTTAAVDAELAAKLPSTLTVLNAADAQDSDSVTVTQATAAKYHLKSIADLKPYASQLVIGGPPEFKTRVDGLVGLKSTYGLTFKSFDPLDESGPITLAALQNGKVAAADVFTTTPQIVSDKLVSLTDPKFNFAAQNVIPLVYKPALTSTISDTLNAVSAKLTTSALLALDVKVITDKENYTTAAQEWLQSVGLS
ncbi:ABC transporter substrate-binding protein [Trebonia kvetii]|uniref:ABC transporter substrate-binding protein n=1 Tax=Trebonia kvetii TaxID=2480626 RepID=A0A6P2C6R8_9ACTN|nr:ABC transporter substrate-binding protein [Trebonia kvetii]TVZ05223.1 ABC transporter substrate-binding protein [Trebonia kvetii]